MNRRSFFTILAGMAAVPALAGVAAAAPAGAVGSAATTSLAPSFEPLADDALEMQRRRRALVVRGPRRRAVVVRPPRRRARVCVRRAGILVCR